MVQLKLSMERNPKLRWGRSKEPSAWFAVTGALSRSYLEDLLFPHDGQHGSIAIATAVPGPDFRHMGLALAFLGKMGGAHFKVHLDAAWLFAGWRRVQSSKQASKQASW